MLSKIMGWSFLGCCVFLTNSFAQERMLIKTASFANIADGGTEYVKKETFAEYEFDAVLAKERMTFTEKKTSEIVDQNGGPVGELREDRQSFPRIAFCAIPEQRKELDEIVARKLVESDPQIKDASEKYRASLEMKKVKFEEDLKILEAYRVNLRKPSELAKVDAQMKEKQSQIDEVKKEIDENGKAPEHLRHICLAQKQGLSLYDFEGPGGGNYCHGGYRFRVCGGLSGIFNALCEICSNPSKFDINGYRSVSSTFDN